MFYLFLSCKKVDHSGEMSDKGCFYFEVFVGIKVQVFLAKSILLEELYRTIKSCYVNANVP